MFRRSRLAILAFSVVFLQAGLLDAFVRCLETWSSVGDGVGAIEISIQVSPTDDEVSHCEDWSAHRIVASPHSLKNDGRADGAQPISFVTADHANLPDYPAQPVVHLLSPFLYPSIAIYQAKVVYRI